MSDAKKSESRLSRKNMLQGAAVTAAALVAGAACADEKHKHMHEGKHGKLIASAHHCLMSGETCMDHCMEFFKKGDTKLAKCADSVNEMLAMCTALGRMAAYNSEYLKDVAQVCLKVCETCEKECRKHAKHHAVCKACADSCKECIRECKKVA